MYNQSIHVLLLYIHVHVVHCTYTIVIHNTCTYIVSIYSIVLHVLLLYIHVHIRSLVVLHVHVISIVIHVLLLYIHVLVVHVHVLLYM